jgi:S1-C subfamily serine protease
MKFTFQLIRSVAVATTFILGIALSINLGLNLFYYDSLLRSYDKPIYQLDNLPPMELKDEIENPFIIKDPNAPVTNAPVVRIGVNTEGKKRFICSGTVVSNAYVITAGHCLHKHNGLGIDITQKYFVESNDRTISVETKAAAIHYNMDYGLLLGDFTKFQKMKIDPLQKGFIGKQGPFAACGYPLGGSDHCGFFSIVDFTGYRNAAPAIQLYPGMSGGPVIDLNTKHLVGINSAVSQGYSLFAPFVNFFGVFNIEVK